MQVRGLRQGLVADAVGRLAGAATTAVDTLRGLLAEGQPASVRLGRRGRSCRHWSKSRPMQTYRTGSRPWRSWLMPGIPTRLERLERATAEVRCVWLYVGRGGRPGVEAAGDGVSRVFVPALPPALPPGLFVVLRHPGGAEVERGGGRLGAGSAGAGPPPAGPVRRGADPRPRHRRRRRILARGRGHRRAPPGAEAGSPPTAERPLPPPATPPPAEWPEWLPR